MDENVYDLNEDTVVTQGEDSANQDQSPVKYDPDEATAERIRNLGLVGTALMERANDNSYETDYLLASDALDRFLEGIEKLNLDPVSEKGMHNLVNYLKTKIQKRLNSNVHMTTLE